ncbi:FAD/NAD(P)-binding domain-containing protein [Cytidiella melzeri]|nr:FAD/NAD(P)-binding domain-containing protein [Cytidiella melzeri]
MTQLVDTPSSAFSPWLSTFSTAMTAADPHGVAAVFLPHGWFRDILTFSWDLRALRGPSKISAYLKDNAHSTTISNITLDGNPNLQPQYVPESQDGIIEAAFTYETPVGYGKGYVQLARGADSRWYALLVCMTLNDLKGHEEPHDPPDWEAEAQGRPYGEVIAERHRRNEDNPYVLIVGAGQTGLQVAARLSRMNIPTLLIEQHERVGDNWRQRYDTLALHTPKKQHHLLYQPYPSNWPLYTPRDKLADWLESYAKTQELTLWVKSKLGDKPTWDQARRRWTAIIDRNGSIVKVQPAHIIIATGVLGAAYEPAIPDRQLFKGTVLHANQYKNAHTYTGKDVVVVGAGNSSIDICQDSVVAGAKSVTMVQRSSTSVTARSNVARNMDGTWRDGEPLEIGDYRFGSTPLGMIKEYMIAHQEETWAADRELHEKLRKGGLHLNIGSEGQGQFLMVFERGGGLDKGGADLIASGAIKIKQGVAPKAFTSSGLLFTDGSQLEADVVILATGFKKIRAMSEALFGSEVIGRTSEVWGLDAEGELQGSYRPCGHPGLWFAAGDFFNSRYMSKHLALQIKARELGYVDDGLRSSL